MNEQQAALLEVSKILEVAPRLMRLEGGQARYLADPSELQYAAQILREVALGCTFRNPPGARGRPAKTPKKAELLLWQLRYHASGLYRGRGELFQALAKQYPDASIPSLRETVTCIKSEIADPRFRWLLDDGRH